MQRVARANGFGETGLGSPTGTRERPVSSGARGQAARAFVARYADVAEESQVPS